MSYIQPEQITEVAQVLSASDRLVILSGAGVSRESGLRTFREAQTGLWEQYDPQQLATPRAFRRNPKLVWDWYTHRRELLESAAPNPGHFALATLEQYVPQVVVVTQNIDGLHHTAGNTDIIELHGNITRNKCFDNCQGTPTLIDITTLEWDSDAGPPACPHCGAWVRPDVVWFEEVLPPGALDRAVTLSQQADVMLVVGTSGVIQPAASLPFVARQSGATIIEVNPELTPISRISQWYLSGPSGEILPRVLAAIQDARGDAVQGDSEGGEDA